MKTFDAELELDRQIARHAGHTFSVLAKASATTPWQKKGERFQDLADAFVLVRSLRAERIAVHIDCEAKGVLYWSSDAPATLNSRALSQAAKA